MAATPGNRVHRQVVAALAILAACTFAALLHGPVRAGALEDDGGCKESPRPFYNNGPAGPLVFYIGDSITDNTQQEDIYAYVNGVHGWHTGILATGGSTISKHRCLNWLSFLHAKQSNARAVVVELGTNDIFKINPQDIPDYNKRLQAFFKVFTQAQWAADYLKSKCVIWVGLNERFDNLITRTASAKAFDNKIKQLASSRSWLHYADYSALIRDNATFRNSLLADSWKVHPQGGDGKRELAAWVARRVDNNCI